MPKENGQQAIQAGSDATADQSVVPLPPNRPRRRVYKQSVNKNRFACHGRLITGPDRKYFWLAFAMIVIPGIAFLAAVYGPLSFRNA